MSQTWFFGSCRDSRQIWRWFYPKLQKLSLYVASTPEIPREPQTYGYGLNKLSIVLTKEIKRRDGWWMTGCSPLGWVV